MREIKFRGWDEQYKTWIFGDLKINEAGDKAIVTPRKDGYLVPCSVERNTVGQFTGHYDEMGTELYEGDIVSGYFEEDEWPAVVEWDEVTASFVLCGQCSTIRFDEMGGLEIEIVGNIHDNPELLEIKR